MTDSPLWQVSTTEDAGITVELIAQPAINLALVHNSVPLVTGLRISNDSGSPIVDLTARMQLHGAGEQLATEWSRTCDGELADGGHIEWDQFGTFVPTVPYLRQLNESHQASISVTVSRMWGPDIMLTAPVRVLAHNEWFNSPTFYDSLAAFVQPNTAAVQSVLGEAAELLRANTGSASLSGYQDGPERAALIAAAIYEALRIRRIRYINPPASFENTGQKVRTSAQVLESRLGTCVDLSVVYAACLEQAGLRPLIWLVEGHALTGFLREDTGLSHSVIIEPNAMVNLIESGRAIPVDAVYYEEGAGGDFASAINRGRKHLQDPRTLRGVLVVTAARRDGVLPLPTLDEAVAAPAADHAPAAGTALGTLTLPAELLDRAAGDDAVLDTTDTAPERVKRWKRSLLDLSTRNRLLNLRASAEVMDIHVPGSGLAVLDNLIHDGVKIALHAHDDLSAIHSLQGARRAQDIDPGTLLKQLDGDHTLFAAVTADKYPARFKTLQRRARTLLEETGNANLYLTLGALVHTTSSGNEARAPLFLLPVKIVGGSGRSDFQVAVDTANTASPNHCLVEWLRIKHNVQIPDLESPRLDESGIDIDYALPAIRAALLEHDLDFRIDEIATLSICQFGTFGMWKDLEESWDVLARSPIVDHLTHRPGESFREPGEDGAADLESITLDETEIPVPIPADGSQLRAVALAGAGRTFVLEGPPGTGKSQTITNLIAHAMAEGKSVLFVAEKQAALDVVRRRLNKIGLGDFTLDLHGRNQRPNAIRAQLKQAMDNTARYNTQGWAARMATYRSRHAPLADYPGKIHERNSAGQSLWDAYDTIARVGDGPTAPIPVRFVTGDADRGLVEDALRKFERVARSFPPVPDNPWFLAGNVDANTSDEALTAAASRLSHARDAVEQAPAVSAVLGRFDQPESARALLPQIVRQSGRPLPTSSDLAHLRSPTWSAARAELLGAISTLHQQAQPLIAVFSPLFIASGDVDPLIFAAQEAQKGLFGKKKRLEQYEAAIAAARLPGVDLTPEQAVPLLRSVPVTRELSQNTINQMRALLGHLAPATWNPFSAEAASALVPAFGYIDQTTEFSSHYPELWSILATSEALTPQQVQLLTETLDAWSRWRTLLGSGADEFARWTGQDHWLQSWRRDSARWSEQLTANGATAVRQWCTLSTLLEPLRGAGLDEFGDQLLTGKIDARHSEVSFIRGVAAASLRERRAAHGINIFDAASRDGEIADFAAAADALRKEQITALPASLLAQRPYQAGALTGAVGQLRRALDTKRGGTSFRNLMERYGEHIVAATPCFFVSPSSLAQFVPPESFTFDLVVFDEASQITVHQAIGALGRARSAVIVGDSQQMPPTVVGQVSVNETDGSDEDEAVAPEDLESILTECVESQVPRLWLSWHYRSQDESLIDFSNHHYYEGRLASLPSPGGDETSGVEMRRVDGTFNRVARSPGHRTNQVEAEMIVAEIQRRLAHPVLAGQSIGVVTFNKQQQELVLNLLEESGDPLVLAQLQPDVEEGIFVKNLENVQGDERDVILFTTAFSKNPGEPKLPLNFGPLTRAGGEKRLNVAVTRARRKVLLFTSFEPSDIDLSRTSSVGMAHLRGYLEMAARGTGTNSRVRAGVTSVDQIQDSIRHALSGRGLDVDVNYGLSDFVLDLVVREHGSAHWQVAIVLDGPDWAERPTVADRDLTPQLLERLMRWGGSLRVWLPDWIDNPEGVLDRVEAAIAAAKEREMARRTELDAAAAAQETKNAAIAAEAERELAQHATEEPALDDKPATGVAQALDSRASANQSGPALIASQAAPSMGSITANEAFPQRDWEGRPATYMLAPTAALGVKEDLDRINSPTVRAKINAAVRETVYTEGPIELSVLARDVGRRFGFNRVSASRAEMITSAVPKELNHSGELGNFVWPSQLDPDTWRGYRTTPTDHVRALTEIAPEEIVNAMMHACARSRLIEVDLMRKTLSAFGLKRLTTQSEEHLSECIAFGVQSGRLILDGAVYRQGV